MVLNITQRYSLDPMRRGATARKEWWNRESKVYTRHNQRELLQNQSVCAVVIPVVHERRAAIRYKQRMLAGRCTPDCVHRICIWFIQAFSNTLT